MPDVAPLNLKMPVLNDTETAKFLKAQFPKVGILVLAMHNDEQMIAHLMEVGANGYLLKDTTEEELCKAIESVYENQFYFNDFVSRALLSGVKSKRKPQPKIGNKIDLSLIHI